MFRLKGQMNALIIVFLIVVFISGGMFLLSLGKATTGSTQNEYMNFYASNLLTTLSRTDVYVGTECSKITDGSEYGKVSEMIKKSFNSFCVCQDLTPCKDWLKEKITNLYLSESITSFKREGYDYHFEATLGSRNLILYDTPEVKNEGKKRWSSEMNLFTSSGSVINIVLLIAPSS